MSRRVYTEGLHHGNDQDAHPDPPDEGERQETECLLDPEEGARAVPRPGRQDRGLAVPEDQRPPYRERADRGPLRELEREWERLALEAKLGSKDRRERPRWRTRTCSPSSARRTSSSATPMSPSRDRLRRAKVACARGRAGGRRRRRGARRLGPRDPDPRGRRAADRCASRKFKPLLLEAKKEAYGDVLRAARGDYRENDRLAALPKARTKPKVDIMDAFELYCSQPRIKGGLDGPTAKRWRPVIERFIAWIKHRDLARVTPQDAVRWRDHMISQGIAPKAVRDVWLAAPRSVSTHMLNALRLEINPFAGIKVEGVKAWKEDDERGFDPEQALTILSATLATPSHLISREMKAARRWVPWTCAYTGARVNEITSLLPSDVQQIVGHWCFVLRPEVTKGKRLRRIPIHKHLIDQGFLKYVEERRKIGKPLF